MKLNVIRAVLKDTFIYETTSLRFFALARASETDCEIVRFFPRKKVDKEELLKSPTRMCEASSLSSMIGASERLGYYSLYSQQDRDVFMKFFEGLFPLSKDLISKGRGQLFTL